MVKQSGKVLSREKQVVKEQQRGSGITQIDVMQRINYLFQLACFARNLRNFDLANQYLQDVKNISQKSVLRINSQLKHYFCRKCFVFFENSREERVVKDQSRRLFTVRKCQKCGRNTKVFVHQEKAPGPEAAPALPPSEQPEV